jgi:hypothetical protein
LKINGSSGLLVDRIQRLEPALDGGDYFIGVCSPDEGSGVVIGLGEEALDGGLEIDERVEHAAFEASLG